MRPAWFALFAVVLGIILSDSWVAAAETFRSDTRANVRCETTKGPLDIELLPNISPIGAKHLVRLIEADFFRDVPLFRTVPGFLMQFGRKVGQNEFDSVTIKDDHPRSEDRVVSRGTLAFAGGGTDSRTNQLFFAFCKSCGGLGQQPWETPVGRLVGKDSHAVLDALEHAHTYGDMPPWGQGPDPGKIAADESGSYLRGFPKLDYMKGCRLAENFHIGL